jgi:hypothetical protein
MIRNQPQKLKGKNTPGKGIGQARDTKKETMLFAKIR